MVIKCHEDLIDESFQRYDVELRQKEVNNLVTYYIKLDMYR